MNDKKLQVDGTALKQIPEEKDNWLPDQFAREKFSPYHHQVEMQDIITEKDEFFAMNVTVTGGGKTFSYAVPAMKNDLFTIVIFPTNALIEDQLQSITSLYNTYFSGKNINITQMTSNVLEKRKEKRIKNTNLSERDLTNSSQIKNILSQAADNDGASFILTNPDIFFNIIRNKYGESVRQQAERADLCVVDEFHHAEAKGRYSFICELDELIHRKSTKNNLKKIVFLSATPDEDLINSLQSKFGPEDKNIFHLINSKNHSKPLSDVEKGDNYRPVMPSLDIDFKISETFKTKEKILTDCYSEILKKIKNTDGRTIIIVDGVREVGEVTEQLRSGLPKLDVQGISGLKSENMREKLQNADVLVANKTLEVGVDIGNVEQIIFSGFGAASFMQRIGRLRSESDSLHKSAICFTTRDAFHSFQSLKEFPQPIKRSHFTETVHNNLPEKKVPELYRQYYTLTEIYRSIHERSKSMSSENRTRYMENACKIVNKYCLEDGDLTQDEIEDLWEKAQGKFGEALQDYRQSSLSALMYDKTSGEIKTYGILSLMRMGDIEFLTENEFDERMKKLDISSSIYKSRKNYVQTFVWYKGPHSRKKSRSVSIQPTTDIKNMMKEHPTDREPVIMSEIKVTVDNYDDEIKYIGTLNKQLHEKLGSGEDQTAIFGYVTEGHPSEVRTAYGLGSYFFTNSIKGLNGSYTLALGENALYLDCYVKNNMKMNKVLRERY